MGGQEGERAGAASFRTDTSRRLTKIAAPAVFFSGPRAWQSTAGRQTRAWWRRPPLDWLGLRRYGAQSNLIADPNRCRFATDLQNL